MSNAPGHLTHVATPVPARRGAESLHIDCDTCEVRGRACSGCVVSVLLGLPDEIGPPGPDGTARPDPVAAAEPLVLEDREREALDVLAASGLLPPLRLVLGDGPEQPRFDGDGFGS